MIYLHLHSNHSLLEGTAPIDALIERAAGFGMTALALTDTGGLYGAVPFYQAARAAGINPILGVSLPGAILLARDRDGYAALCRIVTAYHLQEDFQLLDHLDAPGLFVLTSDLELLIRLRERGGEPLAAITHQDTRTSRYQAGRLHDAACRLGIRPVAVHPICFLDPDDLPIHHVLSAIRLNCTVDTLPPHKIAGPGCWFRPPEAMAQLYRDWPDALANTDWVAERCNLELSLGTPLFPQIDLGERETPFSRLWKRAFEGLKQRYHPLTRRLIDRLRYELDIIDRLGFAPYFLIVLDIVRYARERDIPIVGRGSAANSLVAYVLGITRADPFKYDLYFERFLNPSRTDCPDIDLDICWKRRDEVTNYVYERYGADHVAMISTFNTFQARSAVRETAKAYGLTDSEIGPITRRLPQYHAGDIRTVVRHLPECRGLPIDEEPLKSIIAVSERIDGFPRHLSMHPCGLVIAPEPLTRFVPLQRAAKGMVVTQYNMGPIETLGLVKMDLLGHRSLTVIDDTVHKVRENRGIQIDIEALPEPDPLTAGLIREGRTIGCFQIESPAMRALLRNTLADNTDMLIKTLSLVRPGPSGSGMKKRFIARRLGHEEAAYLHPSLEPVLRDTYGVMLYQEDTLKVAQVIAGMNLAEGDMLRRAMSKKRNPIEMAKSMKTFISKALENGVDQAVAEEIWGLIANFAEYSYCKAHACTYGEISYQCTYLKAHFPAEFLASVLSNRGGFYHPAVYLEELKRYGIEVRPPCINHSNFEYTVEAEAVRVGFVEVRHLAEATVRSILRERAVAPFEDFADLWQRCPMSRPEAEALISAGACDAFGRTRPALQWELAMLTRGGARPAAAGPQLFREESASYLLPHLPDYSRKRRTDNEWTALGLIPSTHPIEYYLALVAGRTLIQSNYLGAYTGQTVTLIGWLIAERRVGLKGRGCMKFCTFEDGQGVFEAVLFPKIYQRYGHLLDSHGPYFITGEVQDEDNCPTLIVQAIDRAGDAPKSPYTSEITPPKHWIFAEEEEKSGGGGPR